jgi:polyribonucleotide nucleotidyltransferase
MSQTISDQGQSCPNSPPRVAQEKVGVDKIGEIIGPEEEIVRELSERTVTEIEDWGRWAL